MQVKQQDGNPLGGISNPSHFGRAWEDLCRPAAQVLYGLNTGDREEDTMIKSQGDAKTWRVLSFLAAQFCLAVFVTPRTCLSKHIAAYILSMSTGMI